jgi:hypothetical protein
MVEIINQSFSHAAEFLDALRLSKPEWWADRTESKKTDRDWQRDWIFRGESSTHWQPLLPSSWRKDNQEGNTALAIVRQQISDNCTFRTKLANHVGNRQYAGLVKPISEEENRQIVQRIHTAVLNAFAEITLVNEFIRLADELGFRVARLPAWTRTFEFVSHYIDLYFPDPISSFRQVRQHTSGVLQSPTEEQVAFWSNEAIALAQHHRIPTRLLDWTKNPLFAAYFAANGVSNDTDAGDCIAVYAVHRHTLQRHLRAIEVPSSDNDFLRAQSGIFTLDAYPYELFIRDGLYPTLAQSIEHVGGIDNPIVHPKKLTLPVSEKPELLRLLWLERITEAHLMPTLDHVATAVQQKAKHAEISPALYL